MEDQTRQLKADEGEHSTDDEFLLCLPGVGNKETFLERCAGGGSCAKACPYGSILMHSTGSSRRLPAIDPYKSPCYLCDPAPCTLACEHDALQQMPPGKVRMGTANLDPYLCLRFAGRDCTICYDSCPLRDEAIIWDAEIEAPLISMEKCTGCGVCLYKCPAPGGAITVETDLFT
jgi:ferredoxin-type protein NapG